MVVRRRRNVMNIDEMVDRLVGDAQLVEDLRLQIQRLQHRLRIYEEKQVTEDHDVEDHDDEENPFHQMMIWMMTLHLIAKEWREETFMIGEVNVKIESNSIPKLRSLILREGCNLKNL